MLVGLLVIGGVAVRTPTMSGASVREGRDSARQADGGRVGMTERGAAARRSLEVWLAERGEDPGARAIPLGIEIPGWTFFRVSFPARPGLEELGERTAYLVVREDGTVVAGPEEEELSRLFRATGLADGRAARGLETLARAVLVFAGKGGLVVSEGDASELARRFEGVELTGPRLERTADETVLAFFAQEEVGPGRAPLSFLEVRVVLDAVGRASLTLRSIPVRFREPG